MQAKDLIEDIKEAVKQARNHCSKSFTASHAFVCILSGRLEINLPDLASDIYSLVQPEPADEKKTDAEPPVDQQKLDVKNK